MPDQRIVRTPDGTEHRFPAEATDAQIQEALSSYAQPSKPLASGSVNASTQMDQAIDQVSRFGSKLASNLVAPIAHPIDAMIGLGNLPGDLLHAQGEEYTKAKDAYSSGDKGKAALHTLAYLLPVIGPMLDNYIDRTKNGQGPEVAADITTMFAAPKLSSMAAEGLAGAQNLIKSGLESGAEDSMVKALGPQGGRGPITRDLLLKAKDRAPALLERQFGAATQAGAAAKAETALDASRAVLDDALKSVPPNRRLPVSGLVQKLQDSKQRFTVPGAGGTQVVSEGSQPMADLVDAFSTNLKRAADPQGTVAFDDLRKIRKNWDDLGKWDKAGTTEQNAKASEFRAAANMLRKDLANDQPSVAAANKEFSFWSDVNSILDRTLERPSQTPSIGVPGIAQLYQLVRSPGMRYLSANTKQYLASALSTGDPKVVAKFLTPAVLAQIQAAQAQAGDIK